jgi:ligand-binding sensor domain-containing protein
LSVTIVIVKKKAPLLYLLCIIILLQVLGVNSLAAQSSLFRNYTTKDGLPSLEVYNVMQDSKGYMWFSTEKGVSRFDGYEFKTFTTNEGLADNMVFESKEDYKGRIWFRSTNKICYYYHDSIFQFKKNDSLARLFGNSLITSLYVDSSDNIYLCSHGYPGMVKIAINKVYTITTPISGTATNFVCLNSTALALAGITSRADISASSQRNDSLIHFCLYRISKGDILLNKEFTWSPNELATGNTIHSQGIEMNNGNIMVSLGSALIILSNNSIVFSHTYDHSIINLSPDKSGNIWVTPTEGPLMLYRKGKFIQYPTLSYLKDKHITSIFEDKEGGLWFTSRDNGVYYLNGLNLNILDKEIGLPWNKISTITLAPDSVLWISSPMSNTVARLYHDSLRLYSIPDAPPELSITGILFHPDNSLWISTTRGLYIYKNSDLTKEVHINTSGIVNELYSKNGSVWINLRSHMLLCKFEKDSLVHEKDIPMNSAVTTTCIDNKDRIWISTFNGLWELANDKLTYYGSKYPILKNRIVDIEKSPQGNLWMAIPSKGLILKNGESFNSITTQNGLLSNFCLRIVNDNKGNVWVATAKGLSHIINHTDSNGICHIDTIKNISLSGISEINCITCVGNILYVGTSTGLVYFNTDNIISNKIPPPIYITSIKINSKNVPVSNGTFNLHYDENYIAISYVGLTYQEAGNTQYRYKMEGIDTGWIYTKYTSVQYPKMPAGKYTFQVNAMNNDGMWNPIPANVNFIITPPFWASWWARILGISLIIGFVYWRIKVIEKREKLKTEVNTQITNMELRVLRAQMDPHFLFNSLNTLTDLVEDKSDNAPKFVNELSRFYRYSFQHGSMQFVPLETEIKQVERYIFMLQIRFSDNLKIAWNINERYMHYLLPIHSMQLLMENITKHNIISSDKPLQVEIMTTTKDTILIKNQLRKKDTRSTSNGLGLNGINELYRLLTNKKITIESASEYFSVELPLIKPEDHENTHH